MYNSPLINAKTVTIEVLNEQAVMLLWPEKTCEIQHQKIIQCQQQIAKNLGSAILETIASYNSLIVYYDFEQIPTSMLCEKLRGIISLVTELMSELMTNEPTIEKKTDSSHQLKNHQQNIIEIPVYYGENAAWDIKEVASRCSMTIEQVISCHSQQHYRAYALGFTPGFCYLGAVDKKLQLPRRTSPRVKVPKGAVAIAEQQTAVYPNENPGGWHIIGQTPIAMYNTLNNHFYPTINVGDTVKFIAIDYQEFCLLGGII